MRALKFACTLALCSYVRGRRSIAPSWQYVSVGHCRARNTPQRPSSRKVAFPAKGRDGILRQTGVEPRLGEGRGRGLLLYAEVAELLLRHVSHFMWRSFSCNTFVFHSLYAEVVVCRRASASRVKVQLHARCQHNHL